MTALRRKAVIYRSRSKERYEAVGKFIHEEA